MGILHAFRVFLALHIEGDVLHRARPVERDDGDHVFNIVRPHLAQRVAHAGAFQLEDTQRLAACHQIIGRLVVEVLPFRPHIAPIAADQLQRAVNYREGLQAEEVELHEPGHLGVFHVELRGRKVGARIIVERSYFDERPVTDHHARCVCASIPV